MSIEEIAKQMVAKGKGILAADESTGTMEKRLKSVNVECTEKNRLHFRETLFSSSSMKTCISGVILFDETLRQTSSSGISIPELIKNNETGILVPPENPSKLAQAINELLSDKEKSEKLAANGNTFVKNNMTWDVILPKYVQFYEDLLND